jgi:hypothetical protein
VTEPAANPPPPTLVGTAVLVGLEGLFVVVWGLLELVSLDTARAGVAITTALFFFVLGAGLVWCALGLFRVHSWARGPVVATQLIGVLLSFSFWGGQTRVVAAALLVVTLAVLAGVLHPATTRALADDEG